MSDGADSVKMMNDHVHEKFKYIIIKKMNKKMYYYKIADFMGVVSIGHMDKVHC